MCMYKTFVFYGSHVYWSLSSTLGWSNLLFMCMYKTCVFYGSHVYWSLSSTLGCGGWWWWWWWWWWWLLLHSAILRSRADSLRSRVILAFYSAFLNIHRSGVFTALAWLVPHETAAVSAPVLCTPYNHAPCHFMQSHTRKVYACLPVTCHLHFWQNDRDLLRATAVTRGFGYDGDRAMQRGWISERMYCYWTDECCMNRSPQWWREKERERERERKKEKRPKKTKTAKG